MKAKKINAEQKLEKVKKFRFINRVAGEFQYDFLTSTAIGTAVPYILCDTKLAIKIIEALPGKHALLLFLMMGSGAASLAACINSWLDAVEEGHNIGDKERGKLLRQLEEARRQLAELEEKHAEECRKFWEEGFEEGEKYAREA